MLSLLKQEKCRRRGAQPFVKVTSRLSQLTSPGVAELVATVRAIAAVMRCTELTTGWPC